MSAQNDIEQITDKLERGLITSSTANVEMVLAQRFRVISNRLTKDVRKALNDAVKSKRLGHFKKDGYLPEVFFHPTFKHLAIDARNSHLRHMTTALSNVCV